MRGHIAADCKFRKEDEGNHNLRRKKKIVLAASAEEYYYGEDPMEYWVLDSGASHHIIRTCEHMHNYKELNPPMRITVGNGATMEAVGVGDVCFDTRVGRQEYEVTLTDVWYVPEAVMNLMSVKRLAAAGVSVHFDAEHGVCALERAGEVIAEAFFDEDLPCLRVKYPPDTKSPMAMVTGAQADAQLWHRRFGHLGYDNLERLVAEDMVKGVNVEAKHFRKAGESGPCEPCVLGKHAKKPFKSSESPDPTEPLELLHMDLCGPLETPSREGHIWIATLLDDYSKMSVVTLLKKKRHVAKAMKEVITQLETRTGKKVKILQTDRGSEYVNAEMKDFCKKKGIVHRLSVAYTPEQNGAAERLNRTLQDRARSMLVDAHLPKELWGEAVNTANYIRNRSPAGDRDRTPWELFYGIKPDVSHLRVFGSTAYAKLPEQKRQKFDPKSRRGIFVGYEDNTKGYRLLIEGKLIISRDVVFDERKRETGLSKAEEAGLLPIQRLPTSTGPPATIQHVPSRRVRFELESAEEEVVEEDDNVDHGLDLFDSSSDEEEDLQAGGAMPVQDQRSLEEDMEIDEIMETTQKRKLEIPVTAEADEQLEEARRYPKRERRGPTLLYVVPTAGVAKVSTPEEPRTLKEALESPQAEFWKQAMDEELMSHFENETWVLEEVPPGVKALPCMWIFKIKKDANGNIERYKARLVALGNRQVPGVDYDEVYAPTSKHTTLRALMAVVAEQDLELHQMDIKTAFLNGELEEEIYMKQPPGYEQGGHGIGCRLQKAIYGLRQAPRAWYNKLKSALEEIGFEASDADPSLWVKHDKAGPVYVLIYVDDMLIAAKTVEQVERVKKLVRRVFVARDLGEARYFIGYEISRNRVNKTLSLTQKKLAEDLLERFGMTGANGRSVPMDPGVKLTKEGEPLDTEQFPYSTLVGSLLYLSVCTRPDIAQAVGALSRYMAKPTKQHWTAAKGVLRYVAGTVDVGLMFDGAAKSGFVGYCDSDYAGDVDTRRSTTGYVFNLHGGAISWSSKLQPTVAASTAEAEYMAAGSAVKEALWLRKLLPVFGIKGTAVKIMCDNQGAIKLLKHPIASIRSKHIDVLHHFARERVARGEVEFEYCKSEDMAADSLTKAVPGGRVVKCRELIGLT